MQNCMVFYPSDTDDGYIAVICHRERDLEQLKKLGWYETAQAALDYKKPEQPKVSSNDRSRHNR
jgi:hypothetical protein